MYKRFKIITYLLALLLSVVCVPKMLESPDSARCAKQKYNFVKLQESIEAYKLRHGAYPDTNDGLEILTIPIDEFPPILRKLPKTPWGEEYVYVSQPHSNITHDYDIYTFSPSLENYEIIKKYSVWDEIDCTTDKFERAICLLWLLTVLTSIIMLVSYFIKRIISVAKKT